MYIYVMRHGQTDWNVSHIMQTYTDISLNETGVMQCKEARNIVENLDYDLVFCSPLKRTRQTLELVNCNEVPIEYDKRLIERNAGEFEGKSVDTFDYKSYWIIGKDNIGDCETIEECKDRVYSFLNEIKEKYKGKNILIVTHNGVCRIIDAYFNGIPRNKNLYRLGYNNAQIKMYKLN